jgi:hypothetical protein
MSASGKRSRTPGTVELVRAPRWLVPTLVGAAVLGGLSLLLPGSPGYDQWSWLLWGREIVHDDLSLSGGTSWKPLPVAFTTVFALFGHAAPDLWLATVRAFGLLALVEAFRVGRRLAGGGTPGVAGGVVSVAGLVLAAHAYAVMVGGSETAVVLLALLAVDLHLAGRRRLALAVGWGVGLIRPEMWPVLFAYGLWLAWREPPARRLAAGLGASLAVLWFIPEWVVAGDPFYGAALARVPTPLTYGGHPDPVGHAFSDLRHELLAPFAAGAAVALVLGLVASARSRRPDALVVVALAALAWIGVDLGLLAVGYAGAVRYFFGAMAVLAVAGGAGWGRLASLAGAPGVVVVAVALAVWSGLDAPDRVQHFRREQAVVQVQAGAEQTLAAAIDAAGGPRRLLACGVPVVPMFTGPMIAWDLGVAPARLQRRGPRTVIFQEREWRRAPFAPRAPRAARVAASNAHWRILTTRCARSSRTLARAARHSVDGVGPPWS